ncbi:mCG148076 [Mus musculus]|nr:mCG148076 [Mus musculus]
MVLEKDLRGLHLDPQEENWLERLRPKSLPPTHTSSSTKPRLLQDHTS